ncbi:LuxR C-terminal-related transcriptional regulator, partial [Microbacterium sp.]|jgi:LuxR family maltose regulon positive regulatory protein|uniref:response regulator transcription factor n=1 Tax=Microbacterium sp. TaxID=51671 RepID=UPI0025DF9816|tara:strand:+ start:113 stop:316 length:204 start_codon:yes stop_codon:yes gene_type:complete
MNWPSRRRPTDSLAQIAARLHVSVNTVKSQVRSLYRRMGVSSRHEAVAEATRLGLVSVRPSESRHPE